MHKSRKKYLGHTRKYWLNCGFSSGQVQLMNRECKERLCCGCHKNLVTNSGYCKDCQKHFHAIWLRELKLWAIHQLGDKCQRCGVSDLEHPEIYDFHHSISDNSWSHSNTPSNDKVKLLVKWRDEQSVPKDIVLLCSNCHRIVESAS